MVFSGGTLGTIKMRKGIGTENDWCSVNSGVSYVVWMFDVEIPRLYGVLCNIFFLEVCVWKAVSSGKKNAWFHEMSK